MYHTELANLPKELTDLWSKLRDFVYTSCHDQKRGKSHDAFHMDAVAVRSLQICHELFGTVDESNIQIYKKSILTAWLHDVADHKYDRDGSLQKQVNSFLHDLVPDEADIILKIIDRISYSKENKVLKDGGKLDWDEVLGKNCLVRDIVSDADKLEALGRIGFERCVNYNIELYMKENNDQVIPHHILVEQIHEHAEEKLLRLKDEFIRTEPGKKMAEELHQELVACLAEFV